MLSVLTFHVVVANSVCATRCLYMASLAPPFFPSYIHFLTLYHHQYTLVVPPSSRLRPVFQQSGCIWTSFQISTRKWSRYGFLYKTDNFLPVCSSTSLSVTSSSATQCKLQLALINVCRQKVMSLRRTQVRKWHWLKLRRRKFSWWVVFVPDPRFADPHLREILNINSLSKNLKLYGRLFWGTMFIPNEKLPSCTRALT